ncbi:acyltransferase [Mariniflexile litorale]|uniref:Acyltransferase n=1 Tax=Mariniflexile litorale TaxID=3045158 RepID=A0AAU7EC83_9FLAO|nr:acyltransferase [Mariniflexile sp. KMM 9835]MDQ8212227.1 acyltransferase [Mariniflexile sp. KMM 9835]
MKQLPLIEGIRGYLALWVVFDHLLGFSGYGVSSLNFFFKIVRSGWYAVDIFIIISGFVIFYLLETKRETYKVFIIRRFFRLWPLFIILFFVAIPFSSIIIDNATGFSEIYQGVLIGDGKINERVVSWKDNMFWHILAHIPMLHGVLPDVILPYSPGAFLGPAWSISLEWQFYLIAPFLFILKNKCKKYGLILISLIFVVLCFLGQRIDDIQFGAFLPMHAEFFLLGIFSFYSFKWVYENKFFHNGKLFYIVIIITSLLYFILDFKLFYLPYFLWINFFALIVDYTTKKTFELKMIVFYLFESKPIKYLGKISYSIYLSHVLVIYITQYFIIEFLPNVSQKHHLLILGLFTVGLTVFFSGLLYKYLEVPLIKKGNVIAKKHGINLSYC